MVVKKHLKVVVQGLSLWINENLQDPNCYKGDDWICLNFEIIICIYIEPCINFYNHTIDIHYTSWILNSKWLHEYAISNYCNDRILKHYFSLCDLYLTKHNKRYIIISFQKLVLLSFCVTSTDSKHGTDGWMLQCMAFHPVKKPQFWM